MVFDVQQHLPDERQPLLFKLLALIEHLLHAFPVLWSAPTQLIQSLLVLLLGLDLERTNKKQRHDIKRSHATPVNLQAPRV